ncbi:MAG: preprotein translocase subunit SecG [Candidatus Omnitrophica bacterium]|nr:preprotein translocase subunit SecG [Candidatus Omnitrophota bacterium]
MTGVLIGLHVLICIGLIILVLVQRGKGGGLVESFSGIETMFGTKTSAFLTKTTTVLAIGYFLTCLILTLVSVKQSRSLLGNTRTKTPVAKSQPVTPAAGQEAAAAKVEEKTPASALPAAVPAANQAANAEPKKEQQQNAPKTE